MKIDWRIVAGAIVLAVWLAQLVGPFLVASVRRAVSTGWPKLKPHLTLGKFWPGLVIAAIFGSSLLPHPSPVPVDPPKAPDLFAKCGSVARELLADEFDKFASLRFDTEQAKEDAINEKIDEVIESSFAPLSAQVSKAIKENRLGDYARKIKAGESDEQ